MPDDLYTPKPSRADFLAGLRKRVPQLSTVSDDDLWLGIVSRRPDVSSLVLEPGQPSDPTAQARKAIPAPGQEQVDITAMSSPGIGAAPLRADPKTGKPSYGVPVTATAESRDKMARGTLEMGGAIVGSEAVSGIKGVSKLPWVAQMLARSSGAGAGAGVGAATGGATPKEAGKTAAEVAASSMVIETSVLGAGTAWRAGAKMIRQLRINPENAAEVAKATAEAAARGEVPARTAHLANINAVEEQTRFAIQSGEGSIERQLSAKYDALGIQVPVDFMPIGQSAQAGEADILGRGLGTVPKPVGAAASDMRSRQMAALRIYQKVMPIFQDYASGSDAFNAGSARKAVDAMNKLKELKGIDFNEAQALKSAIGKNLARSGKLAKDQADALASLRDTIVSNMETAARQQTRLNLAYKEMGVMPEGIQDEFFRFRDAQTGGSFSVPKSKFSVDAVSEEANKLRRSLSSSAESLSGTAQSKQADVLKRFEQWNPDAYSGWQNVEHQWKLFHQDFRNPGAPLKGITNLRPNSTGHTIKTVANKPGAVMDAMKRWNLLSDDFMNVLNNPNLETDAKEARLLARSSEAYFGKTKEGIEAKGEKAATEARKAAVKDKAAGKKKLKGIAALAVGSGTLYEYLHRKGVAPLVK